MTEHWVRLGYILDEPPSFGIAIAPKLEAERVEALVQASALEGFSDAYYTTWNLRVRDIGLVGITQIDLVFNDPDKKRHEPLANQLDRFIKNRSENDMQAAGRLLGSIGLEADNITIDTEIYESLLGYRTLFDPHLAVPIKNRSNS